MCKKMLTILLALTLVLGMAAVGFAAEDRAFSDVETGAYYFDAVNWAVENAITEGMGNGLFQPEETCTRAQVVTFLWRLAGQPELESEENIFSDVEEDMWYTDAVLWAVENEVTDGMGDGIFLPGGTCTRGQIVSFLWKYAGRPAAAEDAENPFTDVAEDDWFYDAVLWAVDEGITTGVTETTFVPGDPCTRAQIVTFLYRYAAEDEVPEVTLPDVTIPTETAPEETEGTEPSEPEATETEPIETEPSEEPTVDPDMGEWA